MRQLLPGAVLGMALLLCTPSALAQAGQWFSGVWDSSIYNRAEKPKTVGLRIEVIDRETGLPVNGARVQLKGYWVEQQIGPASDVLGATIPPSQEREFEMTAVSAGDGVVVFALSWQKEYPWLFGRPEPKVDKRGNIVTYDVHASWTRAVDDIEKVRWIEIGHPSYIAARIPLDFNQLTEFGQNKDGESQDPRLFREFEEAWRREMRTPGVKFCVLDIGTGFSDFGNKQSKRPEFFEKIKAKDFGTVYLEPVNFFSRGDYPQSVVGPYLVYLLRIELQRRPGQLDVNIRSSREEQAKQRDQREQPMRERGLTPYPSQRQDTPTDTRIDAVTPSGNVASHARKIAVSATGACYGGTCPSPQGTIDGDPNSIGGFWSGASGSSQGWVELELDQAYLLSHIRVYSQYWNPAVYGSEGCTRYQVDVSADQFRWVTVRPSAWACRPMRAYPNYTMMEIVFPVQPVKYIKVTITDSSGPASHIWRTQIAEIEAGDENLPLHSWSNAQGGLSSDTRERGGQGRESVRHSDTSEEGERGMEKHPPESEGRQRIAAVGGEPAPDSEGEERENQYKASAQQHPLGIVGETLSSSRRREMGLFVGVAGVVVDYVLPSSPAYKAGLRAGMVIETVYHRLVSSTNDLDQQLQGKSAGEEILVGVWKKKGSSWERDSFFVVLQ